MKKNIKNLLLLFIIVSLFGCGTQKIKFLTTEDGKKQYKNEDGIFVKDDWVELDGDKYFFDKNGYLVTDEWIQDEYYVDIDGKMKKDYWYNDGKSEDYYYLGEDGKYVKDKIIDIGNKKYAFDKNGLWIKNTVFLEPNEKDKYKLADKNGIVVDKEGEVEILENKFYVDGNGEVVFDNWKKVDEKDAYYDENGKRVYKGFAVLKNENVSTASEIKKWCYLDENGDIVKDQYIDVDEQNYCAGKDGVLLSNEWKEYEGKKYFYGPDCYLLKNQIVDDVYYVDDTGAMVINKDININGKMYTFGSDGKGNVKVLPKTSNQNWKISKYSDTDEKYISNKKFFDGIFGTNITFSSKEDFNLFAKIIVDKENVRFKVYNRKAKAFSYTGASVDISIKIDDLFLIQNSKVEWDENDYIKLNYSQEKLFLESCKTGSNAIVIINEYDNDSTYVYGFEIKDLFGLYELYLML